MLKKLFFLVVMALLGIQANAALIITNNSNCTIQVRVRAHDINNTGACALRSNLITIAPGDFEMFANVSSLNTVPGWQGGTMATTAGGTTAWGWDAVEYNGVTNLIIGHPGTCAIGISGAAEDPCGADVGGHFYVVGTNTVADFFY
ncbi:hypothetical protein [Taibaiella koreensis]|uniref:hypothetical protein n=1 Tax=Taibaiella koreensis TaxID=1268548 RepID=UPI0013C2FB81|nr:hypothetical protein [Taibaiella koreensis]